MTDKAAGKIEAAEPIPEGEQRVRTGQEVAADYAGQQTPRRDTKLNTEPAAIDAATAKLTGVTTVAVTMAENDKTAAKKVEDGDKAATDKVGPAKLNPGTPLEEFVKTQPVRAEVLTQDITWTNTVGATDNAQTMQAKAGDVKIYELEKDGRLSDRFYIAPGDQFARTYAPNPGFHRPLPSQQLEGQPALAADSAGEFIKLGTIKAQVLPEGTWTVGAKGEYQGKGGDYLLENWKGEQYIIPKAEFENLYSPAKPGESKAETLRLPAGTGEVIPRTELGEGVTSQSWEKGQIIRDPARKEITVTNIETGTLSTYRNDPGSPEHNRLIRKFQKEGDRLHFSSIAYDHAERLKETQDAQKILAELYVKGGEYERLGQFALSLPNTMTEEYERQYNATPEGQKESRQELRERMARERIAELESDPTVRRVGLDDPHRRPQITLLMGLTGAGKSKALGEIKTRTGAAEIGSDIIKERMPEFNQRTDAIPGMTLKENNGLGATSLMQESNLINDKVLEHMMAKGYNIALEGVYLNKEWTEEFIKEATKKGYDVHLVFVDTPPTTAIENATRRYERDGRYVDPRFIGTHGERPAQNFAYLTEKGTREGWLESYTKLWNQTFSATPVQSGRVMRAGQVEAYEQKLLGLKEGSQKGPDYKPREVSEELMRKMAAITAERPDEGKLKELAAVTRDNVSIAGVLTSKKEIERWISEGIPQKELERIARQIESTGQATQMEDIPRMLDELRRMNGDLGSNSLETFTKRLLEQGERIHKELKAERSQQLNNRIAGGTATIVALMAVAAAALEYGLSPEENQRIKSKLKSFLPR